MSDAAIKTIKIEKPSGTNIIIGQSHFIKTVEDLYEAFVNTVPDIKFGLAFCEASGPCLVRSEGTDEELKGYAEKNAMLAGAGHTFFVLLRNAFPLNVLRAIKSVPEVCTIFCASANEIEVVIIENAHGRGIIGIIDGARPRAVEGDEDRSKRKEFLRKIGYKF